MFCYCSELKVPGESIEYKGLEHSLDYKVISRTLKKSSSTTIEEDAGVQFW
jgi:hypothetical protein